DTKLKREVAIKFLPRHIATSEGERQRFEVEAQAAGGLNHPNIATIYNIEEVDDETFIVMEYIDGQELRDKIDSGPLPIAEALNISLQIVNGLQAAHEKGVTHRDIKSANIMLTDKGDVKIMDFGLSKVRGGPKLTQDQSTLGTAAYMSPEQSRGDEVDHRSDIFSLGVLLYEMVTGQLPFKGDYELAVTFSILNEDPEPITGLRTGVPLELERIVNKCLEKEPSSRYQHADELAVDLGKIKKELETKDSKSVDSIVVPKKRVNQLSIGVGVVVVLLLSFLGYFLFTDEGETTERIPIVVADFLNETDETELNGLSGMLITSLEQSRRLRVFSRSRMFDVLRQLGKSDIEYIDENIARE
ncbi:MAG: protein kinase, partial [Phycisphaerae bacterium]|nr:serine/threonine protein kinase [Phycisphaerae bacterium]NIQ05116.1 serine/threonine protein kinase [Candidatus Korarchaeota archaeon]NIU56153.1 protein kinase [Phycisphaerae bacterium]NIW92726.1 protein kinase [Phycisphaerae bacterium]NIX29858.1 protein kinase [Phycisphaerae bacterium]